MATEEGTKFRTQVLETLGKIETRLAALEAKANEKKETDDDDDDDF